MFFTMPQFLNFFGAVPPQGGTAFFLRIHPLKKQARGRSADHEVDAANRIFTTLPCRWRRS